MACVKKGLSRQDAHEEIRKLTSHPPPLAIDMYLIQFVP